MIYSQNNSFSFNETSVDYPEKLRTWAISLGSLNILANGLFLLLLYISRKYINWKRYAIVTNLTVSDFILNLLYVTMVLFWWSNIFRSVFRNLMVFTFIVNMLSYTGTIFIQYYAVKQPIRYMTVLNMSKIKLSIALIWIVVFFYVIVTQSISYNTEVLSIIVSISELILQGMVMCLNTALYVYVLYISKKQKCQRMYSPKERQLPRDMELRKNMRSEFRSNISYEANTFVKEYKFLVTIGISLLIYWITMLPLWIYWTGLEIGNKRFYFTLSAWKQSMILIWFLRCFFDPLLYIYREPKLLQNLKRLLFAK